MNGPSPDIRAAKAELRRDMKKRLAQFLPDHFEKAGQRAAQIFCATELYRQAAELFVFLPLADEMPTRQLAEAAWKDGKIIVVPSPCPESGTLTWLQLDRWDEPMQRRALGVPEPENRRERDPAGAEMVIVPGLAFDGMGGRLGRGGGYYDRFLRSVSGKAALVGWSLEDQVVEQVPCESHDVPMDGLVTDQKWRGFQA